MITFYATFSADEMRPYIPNVPVLCPASSFARYTRRDGSLRPVTLPSHVAHRAADCGGYVATLKWGDYRYSPEQYVQWLRTFNPAWAATMDYCCEEEIAETAGVVRERQQRTTEMAWRFWQIYRDCGWCWVPTVQGWHVEDYERHADDLSPLIEEMRLHYGSPSPWRVGIGTLCKRANVKMIHSVVNAVRWILPGVPLHLWGVKGAAVTNKMPPQVVSSDSAAWNGLFGKGHEEQRASGLSQREFSIKVNLPDYIDRFYQRQGCKEVPHGL